MSRIDNIHKSFANVADLAFDNLPKNIALIQVLYIRDLEDRSEDLDGKISVDYMMKGCSLYDLASIRERITHKLNNAEIS